MERLRLLAGCAIFVHMGGIHLAYNLFTNRFQPRDAGLIADMQRVSPMLSSRVSMWKAWIGFNASHSLGAMLFGALFIAIALENYAYLRASIALNVILLLVPLSYLALAVKYWFSAPRIGILIAATLIVLSMAARAMS